MGDKQIFVRLNADFFEAVKKKAKAEGYRSIQELVRELLRQWHRGEKVVVARLVARKEEELKG